MVVNRLAEPSAATAIEPAGATVSARASALARRGLDLVVAGTLLLLSAPLLLGLAFAIRLDSPGSPIYRQRRIGLGGREFLVNKFRSMRTDADSARHRDYVRGLIGGGGESHSGLYKLAVDDRVTRVGRFLRKWSLDELPQLWNVVRGEMSLVGPRPVIPYEVDCYPDWYHLRFTVKPGLTGLWQVSGRNERSYDEMVRLDVEYAQRRTLWLDLTILARTAWVVLSRRGVA